MSWFLKMYYCSLLYHERENCSWKLVYVTVGELTPLSGVGFPQPHTLLRDLGWNHKCWTLCRPLQFSWWFANLRKPKPGEWWWPASRCSDNHVFAKGWMCSKLGGEKVLQKKKSLNTITNPTHGAKCKAHI